MSLEFTFSDIFPRQFLQWILDRDANAIGSHDWIIQDNPFRPQVLTSMPKHASEAWTMATVHPVETKSGFLPCTLNFDCYDDAFVSPLLLSLRFAQLDATYAVVVDQLLLLGCSLEPRDKWPATFPQGNDKTKAIYDILHDRQTAIANLLQHIKDNVLHPHMWGIVGSYLTPIFRTPTEKRKQME